MNKLSQPLLCRAPLLPGESLLSFLVRLSLLNNYTPHMVMRLCKERVKKPPANLTRSLRSDVLEAMASLTLAEPEELYRASIYEFQKSIIRTHYEPYPTSLPPGSVEYFLDEYGFRRDNIRTDTDLQFCPLCLSETPYHQSCWMLLASSICLKHQCLLLQKCPKCQSQVSITAILKAQCEKCAFNLTKVSPISMADDEFGLFSQSVIQSWFLSLPVPASDQFELLNQPVNVLFGILNGLRKAIANIKDSWEYVHEGTIEKAPAIFPCDKKSLLSPIVAYRLFATAFKGITNWPNGFYEFLSTYRFRDDHQHTGLLEKDFGILFTRWVMIAWKRPEFEFVRESFYQFMQRLKRNTRSIYAANLGLGKNGDQSVDLDTAIRMLSSHGITAIEIIKRVLDRELRGGCKKGEPRLDKLRIRSLDIDMWIEGIRTNRHLFNHSQIAFMLGYTVREIRGLVREGFLKPVKQLGNYFYFEREVIDSFGEICYTQESRTVIRNRQMGARELG